MNEIDIIGLISLLWKKKKRIIYNCSIAFVLAVVIAFSLPKEYTAEVTIAPELSAGESNLGGLGSLAQMAGVNLGGMSDNEALHPDLYPIIVSSTPFLTDLLELKVKSQDGSIETTLYDYLLHHCKAPWWKGLVSVLKSGKDGKDFRNLLNIPDKELTRDELLLLGGLGQQLEVTIEPKDGLITVQATMQDPLIAATVAQTITEKLQIYVDKYRTAKERNNVAYFENLYKESSEKYKQARQRYAQYADSHQDAFLASVRNELTNLENELQLAYSIHTQVAQQLEAAKAKLQEKKPIFAVLQPATVPFMPSAPKKKMIVITYVFFALFGTLFYILVKEKITRVRSCMKGYNKKTNETLIQN